MFPFLPVLSRGRAGGGGIDGEPRRQRFKEHNNARKHLWLQRISGKSKSPQSVERPELVQTSRGRKSDSYLPGESTMVRASVGQSHERFKTDPQATEMAFRRCLAGRTLLRKDAKRNTVPEACLGRQKPLPASRRTCGRAGRGPERQLQTWALLETGTAPEARCGSPRRDN